MTTWQFSKLISMIIIIKSSMKNNIAKPAIDDIVRLSLVNNLKAKIEDLKREVEHQKTIIEGYKRSTKTTLINEQQIQIQKLNDENKRLLLIIEDMKCQFPKQNKALKGMKNFSRMSSIMHTSSTKKKDQIEQNQSGQQNIRNTKKQLKKCDMESKYYEILIQNEKMRKQLVVMKANDNVLKNRKPLNERSSVLMENNINEMDKVKLKCYQLEAQLACSTDRNGQLKKRVAELEELLEQALQINKSMRII